MLGDPRGTPPGQPAGGDFFPEPGQPVTDLEHLAHVAPSGVGGHPECGGELDDRELRDVRRTNTRESEAGVATELHIGGRLVGVDLVGGTPLDDQLQLADLLGHLRPS